MMDMRTVFIACSLFACMAPAHSLTLVADGGPEAVIVVADDATMTAQYAAEELALHVEKATGVRLEMAAESAIPEGYASRVFVGLTDAARAQHLDTTELERDAFFVRTVGSDLFVLGQEDPELDEFLAPGINRSVIYYGYIPRDPTPPNGTLFGGYELLGRYAGVRWLWPGELGTYVPATDRIEIGEALDETHTPAVKMRNFGWQRLATAARAGENPELERIGFTRDGFQQYHADLAVYLARHRLGRSERHYRCRHEFTGWWEEHGAEHPEWFMLNEEGNRGPLPGANTRHVAPCVSNPDLHRYIVEEHWPGPGHDLALGDVDSRVFCHCDDCRAWDVEPDQPLPEFVRYDPVVSNRYARFWNTIAEMAAERDPDVVVTTFLYWNYMPAPAGDISLHPNIYGEFAPWSHWYRFYPMIEEADQWLREQWLGWRRTGIEVAYRPNTFHAGYVMPYLSTRQAGEFFQFAYENGMRAFHFDTLFGHWSTRGPMLYMFMRLSWQPDLEIDEVLAEYYSGFGPAAEHVRAYFDCWEQYSRTAGSSEYRSAYGVLNPVRADRHYPEDCFAPGFAHLDRALEAARTDANPDYAKRVEFLRAGLEHARLASRMMATLEGEGYWERRLGAPGTEAFERTQKALQELIRFRRETEHLYISDLHDAARRENNHLDIGGLLGDPDARERAAPDAEPIGL